MKKQKIYASPLALLCGLGILLVLLAVGSSQDYELSKAIYNESNLFGITFAAFGEYPASLGFVAAGTMLFLGRNTEKKGLAVFQSVSGVVLAVFGAVFACFAPTHYLSAEWIGVLAGIVMTALTVFGTVYLCKNADRETIIKVACVIFLVIFAEMIIVNAVKVPWGRPRYRLVANRPGAYFMQWWDFGGGPLKVNLLAAGVPIEEFKSFPSGHTANAAVLTLLGLIPMLKKSLKGKEDMFFGIGFLWACVVAFSRIIMGAHYLTDTVFGLFISVLTAVIVIAIVFRREIKEINKANKEMKK